MALNQREREKIVDRTYCLGKQTAAGRAKVREDRASRAPGKKGTRMKAPDRIGATKLALVQQEGKSPAGS